VPAWLLRSQGRPTVTWLGTIVEVFVAHIASQHTFSHEFADQFARDDADLPTNAGPSLVFRNFLLGNGTHLYFALPIVMANDSNNLQ
jgi:hypothetical protein